MISKLFFKFTNFCVIDYYKLLTLGILFSTAVNTDVVTKLLTLGILPSLSLNLALQSDFLIKLLVSGIFFSNFVLSASYLILKQIH